MVWTSLQYKLVGFKIAWTPIHLPSPGRFLPPKHLGTPWALCGPLYLGQAGTLTETSCLWGPVPPLALIPQKSFPHQMKTSCDKQAPCLFLRHLCFETVQDAIPQWYLSWVLEVLWRSEKREKDSSFRCQALCPESTRQTLLSFD